jgi:predicted signal transduction protein with EAL and GGDEF domain
MRAINTYSGVFYCDTRCVRRGQGCQVLQGYLFGRPMPADQFTCLLREHVTAPASGPRDVAHPALALATA